MRLDGRTTIRSAAAARTLIPKEGARGRSGGEAVEIDSLPAPWKGAVEKEGSFI